MTQPSRISGPHRLAYLPAATGLSKAYLWRRRGAIAVAVALASVMAYGVVFGHNGLTAYQQKRHEERLLKQQTDDLQRENSRLRGHVDRLQSDPGAIEHQAREELHYTRPGEVIYSLDASELGDSSHHDRP